jgi:hypothetical protein
MQKFGRANTDVARVKGSGKNQEELGPGEILLRELISPPTHTL